MAWWQVSLWAGLVLAVAAQPEAARAQVPLATFAYIIGRTEGLDLASNSEMQAPDGQPDGWVRVLVRAIGYNIAQASGRPRTAGISGYYTKSMTLRHKTIPGLRWDTIPGNNVPLLVVVDGDRIANAPNGSVAGLNLSVDRTLDLHVADPGQIGWHVAGFVLEIDTLDGKLVLDVQPHNIYEANFRY